MTVEFEYNLLLLFTSDQTVCGSECAESRVVTELYSRVSYSSSHPVLNLLSLSVVSLLVSIIYIFCDSQKVVVLTVKVDAISIFLPASIALIFVYVPMNHFLT